VSLAAQLTVIVSKPTQMALVGRAGNLDDDSTNVTAQTKLLAAVWII